MDDMHHPAFALTVEEERQAMNAMALVTLPEDHHSLKYQAGYDYCNTLPNDFWSPTFGQPAIDTFDFKVWRKHYAARRETMTEWLRLHLENGGTILERGDILWNLTGTRHIYANGVIGEYGRTFIAVCWNADYLAKHICNRVFGFGFGIAAWLQPDYKDNEVCEAHFHDGYHWNPCTNLEATPCSGGAMGDLMLCPTAMTEHLDACEYCDDVLYNCSN